ncbi:MAG: MBL fold metallo-hydrolase [Patescibacteria group bacterium]
MLKKIEYLIIILLLISFIFLFFLRKNTNSLLDNENIAKKIEIIFMDVGQGDGILLNLNNGEKILVDCSEDARILEALGRNMDYYDKTIDYLLITHEHSDHYGGCEEVINRFEVKNVIYNGLKIETDKIWQSFLTAVNNKNINLINIDQNQTWNFGSSTVNFFYPEHNLNFDSKEENSNLNNTSIIFGLDFNSTTVLFTGDMEVDIENYLVSVYKDNQLKSDILKAGHHGSDTSSGQEFLNAVKPQETIVSVGKNNNFGHPSRRILKRLERINSNVWRTDFVGDIILEIGESGYKIRTPQINN